MEGVAVRLIEYSDDSVEPCVVLSERDDVSLALSAVHLFGELQDLDPDGYAQVVDLAVFLRERASVTGVEA